MEDKGAKNGGGPDRPARNVGSRKRARGFPKGRQLDLEARREVCELLGKQPRRPDLLIEFLHLIQDRYGCLSARHLRALCEEDPDYPERLDALRGEIQEGIDDLDNGRYSLKDEVFARLRAQRGRAPA